MRVIAFCWRDNVVEFIRVSCVGVRNMRYICGAVLFTVLSCHYGPSQGSPEGAWNYVTAGHGQPVRLVNAWGTTNMVLRTNILVISALFQASGGSFTAVDVNGTVRLSHGAYSWAEYGGSEHQLSKTNLARLRVLIRELAATTNSTPVYATNFSSLKTAIDTQAKGAPVTVARLVMVSFHDGRNWVMRQYVDDALPDTLYKINDTIFPEDRYMGMRLRGTYRH